LRLRNLLAIAALAAVAGAAGGKWNLVLQPEDVVAGEALQKLNTRRRWAWKFVSGRFEVAVRKSAVPVKAAKCRMEYLILTMPVYYPENPAQAPMADRRAVYDALIEMKRTGRGSLTVRLDGSAGMELTGCNLYFALPLK
jgi:hypothetical protein